MWRGAVVLLLCGGVLIRGAAAEEPAPPTEEGAPTAQPPAPSDGDLPVIPPGDEELLAQMLGRGETLAGQCVLTAGDMSPNAVKATYKCHDGDVVFELRHASTVPYGATHTRQFGLVVLSGSPPPGLEKDLEARIRAREGTFQWKWVAGPPSPWRIVAALAGAGVLLIAVFGALRRRRRLAGGNP
jgi:hypothetical protein